MTRSPDEPEPQQPAEPGEVTEEVGGGARSKDEARAARERARRRAQVFGDVLPESTRDDRDDTGGPSDRSSEEWLRRQRPPHHGD
jgi:hypothetical protein